jgi:amidase
MAAPFTEYTEHDGLGLAELVRSKQVTPAELVDAAIDRIEAQNGSINAVVHRMYDRAREAARGPLGDGPFAGVPFLLKDMLSAYAGEPLTAGCRFFRTYTPTYHSELVSRLLRAGVVVVGKTNTPELGLLPVTEPELFGPTRNPWDLTRTPGGSSGGSAAAVAARMVPVAGGGDGGGSIRIPASCCGLFGLKPTRGRTPSGPDEADLWEGFGVEHVLTRSVRDCAAMLDVTAGADAGAPFFPPPPPRPFLSEVEASPGCLRIAVSVEPPLSAHVHADCKAAVDDAARLLRDLGHEVVDASPRIDRRAFARAMVTMLMGQVAADVRDGARKTGRQAGFRDFESATWVLKVMGETLTAGEYQSAVRTLRRIARDVSRFTDAFDAWLTPTLAMPPVRIGELASKGLLAQAERVVGRLQLGRLVKASGVIDQVAERLLAFVPYTPIANATGQPSMSVPLYWSADGLPIGVMFTARYGDEATLLRLAGQLEKARPWKDRAPPAARAGAGREA